VDCVFCSFYFLLDSIITSSTSFSLPGNSSGLAQGDSGTSSETPLLYLKDGGMFISCGMSSTLFY